MARLFRLWNKKRGRRRTGSRLLGEVGEAAFFGAIFLVGALSLSTLIVVAAEQSTADSTLGVGFWLMFAVFTAFVVFGGGGVFYAVLRVGVSKERRASFARRARKIDLLDVNLEKKEYPGVPSAANLSDSPGIVLRYRLPASQESAWQLLAMAAACLIWNGAAAVILVAAIRDRVVEGDWRLAILLAPLAAAGGWLFYLLILRIAAFSGAGPTYIEISDHPLFPGANYEVIVSQMGRSPLRSLEVDLVCQEQATYLQGTDIRRERRQVYSQVLLREERVKIDPLEGYNRRFTFDLPAHIMHSFSSDHNAVQWRLVVRADPRMRPRFERIFPIIVFPPRLKDSVESGL